MRPTLKFRDEIHKRLDASLYRFATGDTPLADDLSAFANKPILWQFGVELDFMPHASPHMDDLPFINAKRAYAEEAIRQRFDAAHDNPQILHALETQLKEISDYSAQDLMLWDIFTRLEDIIDPKFSRAIHQQGYYDNPGCGEIQIRHGTAAEIIAREQRVLDTIDAVVSEYRDGAKRDGYEGPCHIKLFGEHINASASIEDDNGALSPIFDTNNPAMTPLAQRVMRGIVTMHNASNFQRIDNTFSATWGQVGFSRDATIRMAKDRFELRTARDVGHLEDWLNRIVSAAEYTITQTDNELNAQSFQPVEFVQAGSFENAAPTPDNIWGDGFYVKRILQTSPMVENDDGSYSIQPSPYYLKVREAFISRELGGHIPHEVLQDIFASVKILPNGEIDYSKALRTLSFRVIIEDPERMDHIEQQFASVRFNGTFTSLQSAPFKGTSRDLHAIMPNKKDFESHPLMHAAYGDALDPIAGDYHLKIALEDSIRKAHMDAAPSVGGNLSYDPTHYEEDMTVIQSETKEWAEGAFLQFAKEVAAIKRRFNLNANEEANLYSDAKACIDKRREALTHIANDHFYAWRNDIPVTSSHSGEAVDSYHNALCVLSRVSAYTALSDRLDAHLREPAQAPTKSGGFVDRLITAPANTGRHI